MAVVSMNYLLEAGVHFGHQTKRWNPKMKEYIFTSRDDIYIIDLQKTAKKIEEAYAALKQICENGGKVVFVGTRKQAQEAAKEEATRVGMFYVTERWLGGTLTNFKTIRRRVKRLEEIEKMEQDGTFDVLPKKEVIGLRKEYAKLNNLLSGIREMSQLPSALYIVDPTKEDIAIKEARKLHIPVFGIVDTNCDPDMVDYVIPGNDDAIRAVRLITGVMANAVAEATGGKIIDFVSEDDHRDGKEIMQQALETVKRKEDRPRRFDDRKDFRRDGNRDNRRGGFQGGGRFHDHRENRPEGNRPEGARPFSPRPPFNSNHAPVAPAASVAPQAPVVPQAPQAPVKEVAPQVEVKPKVETVKTTKDLSACTVAELRELAKEKDIKGYSTMKKAELLEALN